MAFGLGQPCGSNTPASTSCPLGRLHPPLGSASLRPHHWKKQGSPWHVGTCVASHWPAEVPGLPRLQACGRDSTSGKRSYKVTLQRGVVREGQWWLFLQVIYCAQGSLHLALTTASWSEGKRGHGEVHFLVLAGNWNIAPVWALAPSAQA